jgi:hypothetical protein
MIRMVEVIVSFLKKYDHNYCHLRSEIKIIPSSGSGLTECGPCSGAFRVKSTPDDLKLLYGNGGLV